MKAYSRGRASRRAMLQLIAVGTAGIGFARHAFAEESKTEVMIDNFVFVPEKLEVKAGSTVTWKNEDDIPHSIVANAKQFRSSALDTGESFSFTFSAPGTYQYFCGLHPHMTGTIVVTA